MADKTAKTPKVAKRKTFHVPLADEQHAAICAAAAERYIAPNVFVKLVLTGVMPSPLATPSPLTKPQA